MVILISMMFLFIGFVAGWLVLDAFNERKFWGRQNYMSRINDGRF